MATTIQKEKRRRVLPEPLDAESTKRHETLRMEVHEGPDSHGRYHYSLHFMDDFFPGHPEGECVVRERGQHFFGLLPDISIKRTKDLRV